MANPTPACGPEIESSLAIQQFTALLAAERAHRARLQDDLDLRNCVLDATTTHFMVIDISGARWAIIYANHAIARDHGYEPAELLGRTPACLVPPELNPEAFQKIGEAVKSGRTISTEVLARHKNGSTFHVGMYMAPIHIKSGGARHYLGVGADITAKRAQQLEQQHLQEQLYTEMRERERMAIELRLAQKLESVGRLAAGVAHEINTPIQYIGDSVLFLKAAHADLHRLRTEYANAFERLANHEPLAAVEPAIRHLKTEIDLDFLTQEIPKAFDRTLEGVERVAAIVHAMKEFAHPDSVEHSTSDLNHAIETTLTVARNEYKYIASVETHFGELPLVLCNVGELNQVFLNLIVNAAHAISESGKDVAQGRISITTAADDAEVTICIADNGCGIPTANLEKVFDPFFTTKPVGRGTGQGLAIARSIVVEKHGGRIDIESTMGSGTRFILRLPVTGRGSRAAT